MSDIDVAGVFLWFIVLLFSLTVHESAHAWVASRLGDSTARLRGRVSLNPIVHADPIGTVAFPLIALLTGAPLIGWAKPVPVDVRQLRNPRRDYMLVAAAGPVSNMMLAVAAALIRLVIPISPMQLGEPNVTAPVAALLTRAVQLNILLALFNLIPVPPLDGSNILAGLLPPSLGRVMVWLRPYGFLILYALMLTGVLEFIIGPASVRLASWLL
ncbi:MAG TPA: site-2 protease family protein [Vicinamibacterales bacterium]|nr:site-2 protease family protein [Vicinamibacterales bacterium]